MPLTRPNVLWIQTDELRADASIRFAGRDIPFGAPRREPCLIDVRQDQDERSNVSGREEYAAVDY